MKLTEITMKRILIILPLMLSVSCSTITIIQPGLSGYKGKDLRKLKGKELEAFMQKFQDITGEEKRENSGSYSCKPWWVKEYQYGPVQWILLEGYPGYAVPDISYIKVHRFKKDWTYLGVNAVPTGYRIFLDRVDLVNEPILNLPVIKAYTNCQGPFRKNSDGTKTPMAEASQRQCQVYAVLPDRVAMIRLEDGAGKTLANSRGWNPPKKGLSPKERTVSEWIDALKSENPVKVLESLLWLSNSRYPKMITVRRQPEVVSILQNLRDSSNAWIKDYASLILESQKGEVFVKTEKDIKGKLLSWGELITGNKDVSKIELRRDVLSDEDLKILTRFKRLEFLDLAASDKLTVTGILNSIPSVKELHFSAERTNGSLKPIKRLTELDVLSINRCLDLKEEDFIWIGSLPKLKYLRLWWCSNISDEAMAELSKIKSLAKLELWGASNITDKGFENISKSQKLEHFRISHAKKVTAEGISHLKQMKTLRCLRLAYMPVNDECMVEIGKIKGLRELQLTGLDITDKGLGELKSLNNLSSVTIERCKKVSPEMVKEFSRK